MCKGQDGKSIGVFEVFRSRSERVNVAYRIGIGGLPLNADHDIELRGELVAGGGTADKPRPRQPAPVVRVASPVERQESPPHIIQASKVLRFDVWM